MSKKHQFYTVLLAVLVAVLLGNLELSIITAQAQGTISYDTVADEYDSATNVSAASFTGFQYKGVMMGSGDARIAFENVSVTGNVEVTLSSSSRTQTYTIPVEARDYPGFVIERAFAPVGETVKWLVKYNGAIIGDFSLVVAEGTVHLGANDVDGDECAKDLWLVNDPGTDVWVDGVLVYHKWVKKNGVFTRVFVTEDGQHVILVKASRSEKLNDDGTYAEPRSVLNYNWLVSGCGSKTETPTQTATVTNTVTTATPTATMTNTIATETPTPTTVQNFNVYIPLAANNRHEETIPTPTPTATPAPQKATVISKCDPIMIIDQQGRGFMQVTADCDDGDKYALNLKANEVKWLKAGEFDGGNVYVDMRLANRPGNEQHTELVVQDTAGNMILHVLPVSKSGHIQIQLADNSIVNYGATVGASGISITSFSHLGMEGFTISKGEYEWNVAREIGANGARLWVGTTAPTTMSGLFGEAMRLNHLPKLNDFVVPSPMK